MSKVSPFALMALALLAGCAQQSSVPDADPKVMLQFQDSFQAAIYRSISSHVQEETVGAASLRIVVNRQGQATRCKVRPPRPGREPSLPNDIERTSPRVFADFLEQRCLQAIYPTGPDALYDDKGEVEVVAPVSVMFNNLGAERWKTRNAQRRFFREHLLKDEHVDSVGIVVIQYQADGSGCLVNLRFNDTRPKDFKLDGALQGRLNQACARLDLSQVPKLSGDQQQAVGLVSLEYAPWTVGH